MAEGKGAVRPKGEGLAPFPFHLTPSPSAAAADYAVVLPGGLERKPGADDWIRRASWGGRPTR